MNLILARIGDNKVQVIKVLRDVSKITLQEAKEIVEKVRAGEEYIIEGIQEEDMQLVVKKFMAAGAEVIFPEGFVMDETMEESKDEFTKKADKIFEKVDNVLVSVLEWHKNRLNNYSVPAILLLVVEALIVITLLIKYWEVIGAIFLLAAFVAPFIFRKDFDDENRNNVKVLLREMGSGIIKWLKWIAIIVVIVVLINFIANRFNPTAVVRNSYFENFSTDITIGEAFDRGFDRGEWEEFKENGTQYVRFTGYYVSYETSNGDKFGNTCQIDFIVNGDTFDIAQVRVDGAPAGSLSSFILSGILSSVYERNGVSY